MNYEQECRMLCNQPNMVGGRIVYDGDNRISRKYFLGSGYGGGYGRSFGRCFVGGSRWTQFIKDNFHRVGGISKGQGAMRHLGKSQRAAALGSIMSRLGDMYRQQHGTSKSVRGMKRPKMYKSASRVGNASQAQRFRSIGKFFRGSNPSKERRIVPYGFMSSMNY